MLDRDKYVLEECVLNDGKHLACGFPEACNCCIYRNVKGKGKKYLFAARSIYRRWEKFCRELY